MAIDIASLLIKVDAKELKEVVDGLGGFTEACNEAADKTASSLAESLLAQEEATRQSYENRYGIMMEASAAAEEGLTAVMTRAAQERCGIMAAFDAQNTQSALARYQKTYTGISGIVGDFVSALGGAYGEMFGLSKAFAIADTTMQIANAVAKAAATPFPANLAAMATVAASTAGLLSQIKGANFSGPFDLGGNIMAGKWGIVGEYGPEIVRGPASVTGRRETAELAREAMAQNMSIPQETTYLTANFYDERRNVIDEIRTAIRTGEFIPVMKEALRAVERS